MIINDLFDQKFVEIVAIKKNGNLCYKTIPVNGVDDTRSTLPMFPAEKERKQI